MCEAAAFANFLLLDFNTNFLFYIAIYCKFLLLLNDFFFLQEQLKLSDSTYGVASVLRKNTYSKQTLFQIVHFWTLSSLSIPAAV